ncbi:MAG: hypothetical protein A2Y10_15385 [Planctomycetes bacterium GWF2_41_51]|nr:MAG: hypothetical protein A2Y10_15385 [Planctomycetes bacterium GWF2_41_51]HBG26984.1 hypothetical protein [Phycisphaerales bacterium]
MKVTSKKLATAPLASEPTANIKRLQEKSYFKICLLSTKTEQLLGNLLFVLQWPYISETDNDTQRIMLKERILAVKQANIGDIKIAASEKIIERFLAGDKVLKPRHTRDIGRFISLVKVFALLNLWFREKSGSAIVANDNDIEEAFKVWDIIADSQELNLPPYIYQLYKEVILPAYAEMNDGRNATIQDVTGKLGLSRQAIIQKHYQVYGRYMPDWQLRQQIIPMLETSGLITQEPDPNDKRKILTYPTTLLTISQQHPNTNFQNNSELGGMVK